MVNCIIIKEERTCTNCSNREMLPKNTKMEFDCSKCGGKLVVVS